ncbi:hypothetical protein [Streptomyces sp. NPDC001221]
MPTTMGKSVDLPLSAEWPKPAPNCRVCAALTTQREQAQAAGDYSKVSDLNVEVREHKDDHPRRRR